VAAGSAITAKLGLDAGEFRKGLVQLRKELQTVAKTAAESRSASVTAQAAAAEAAYAKSQQKRVEVAESLWEKEKKVENQMVSLAGRLATVTSASDAFAASATALAESLNLSLGAAIGAGVGIAIGSQLTAASEKADELRTNLSRAIAAANMTEAADGIANVYAGLSNIATTLKEIKPPEGFLAFMSEGFDDMGAANASESGEGKRAKLTEEALKARTRLYGELAKAEKQIADIQQMILDGDDEGAALAKVQLEYDLKRAEFRKQIEQAGGGMEEIAKVESQINRQQALAEQKIREDADKKRGESLAQNMAAEAKAALERKKLADEAEEAGRDTALNMAEETNKWLAAKKKATEEAAEKQRKEDKECDDAEMEHIDNQREARKKAAEDDLAQRKASIAEVARESKAKLDQRVSEIRNPGSRAASRREEREQKQATKRAIREESLADRKGQSEKNLKKFDIFDRTGKSARDVKRADVFGPKLSEFGGKQGSIGAELDATKMASDIKDIAKNLKPAKL
jgi:hypothetical protein